MITELTLILETLKSIGIDEVIIDPAEEGSIIRASNADGNIIIHDQIPEQIAEYPMGIQSVRGLLSRIELFDPDKTDVDMEDNGDYIRGIKLKQGRKTVTFRFCPPRNIHAPAVAPTSTQSEPITFTKELVKDIRQAITAMSFTGDKQERTISINGNGSRGMELTIYDGEDDAFSDTLDNPQELTNSGVWEVVPFQRVMIQSSTYNIPDENATLYIDDIGIATFDLEIMKVMILPMTS